MLPFEHTWLPFIYLYGIGGLFFLIGMYIVKKSGAMDLKKKRHLFWYRILIFGFIFFVCLHAILIIAALYW